MDKFVKLWKEGTASQAVDLSPKKHQRQAKLFELKKVCSLGDYHVLGAAWAPSIRACLWLCTWDLM